MPRRVGVCSSGSEQSYLQFLFLEGVTLDTYGVLCFPGCDLDTMVNFMMTVARTVLETG